MPPHLLVGLAAAVVLWMAVAALRPTTVPTPVVLVVGGVVLGFVPGLPDVVLNPRAVLLGLLPLLVFYAAFSSSHRAFLRHASQIGLLAVGLVIVTAGAVAAVAHRFDHLSWPMSFVLGTAVGPTDAVAVTSIARKLGFSNELSTVLNGEALFNDSTALVLYSAAVAAAYAGHFSIAGTLASTAYSIAVGVGVGLGVGIGGVVLLRRLSDAPVEIALSLLVAYAAYLPAQALDASGVLAAVTAGLFLGWRNSWAVSATTRLQATAFWDTLVFLLDAALFALVGLSIHSFTPVARGPIGRLVLTGLVVVVVVVVMRLSWMALLFWILRPLRRVTGVRHDRRDQVVIAWSGMRGAVTLAAVLAVPTATSNGVPLAGRDDVIYLAFGVIFATLIGQGLTLPWVARRFTAGQDPQVGEIERRARIDLVDAALDHLESVTATRPLPEESVAVLRSVYESRRRRLANASAVGGEDAGGVDEEVELLRELLAVERGRLLDLRSRRRITSAIAREIEKDLDREEARLRPL
jgi:Na+/H+ antiporter